MVSSWSGDWGSNRRVFGAAYMKLGGSQQFGRMIWAITKSVFHPKTRRAIRVLDHAFEYVYRYGKRGYGRAMTEQERDAYVSTLEILNLRWKTLYCPWL